MAMSRIVSVAAVSVALITCLASIGCTTPARSQTATPSRGAPSVSAIPHGWRRVSVSLPSRSVLLPESWVVSVNTSHTLAAGPPSSHIEVGLGVSYMPPSSHHPAPPWDLIYPNSHRSAATTGTLFGVTCRMRSWLLGNRVSTAAWRVDETSAMVTAERGPDISDIQTATIILRSLGVTGPIPPPRPRQ